LGCVEHASSAHGSIDISTAVEETVYGAGGGFADGGVVERDVSGGVGGESGEEGVDIGTVEAILGDGSVCTDVLEEILGSYVMSGQVEEGNHERNKHDGKKEGIERSHFGDPICNNYARFSVLQCFGAIIYEWRFN
jgi:hypothetical protein